jgi:hypothetical protein
VAGLVLLDPRAPGASHDRLTLVGLVVGAVMMVSTRPLSPVWLGLMGTVLLLTSSRRRLRALLGRRDVRAGTAVVALAAVAAVAWLRTYRPLQGDNTVPANLDALGALRVSFEQLGTMWIQIVGVFGWLDAPSPWLVVVVWCAALVTFVAAALASATPSLRVALAAATAVAIAVPPLIQATQLDTGQPIWQGRYTLPLALGMPILAGWALDRGGQRWRDLLRHPARVALAGMALGHLVAFYFALRRYVVGTSGPVWIFGREQWDAPVPPSVLVLGFATLCGGLVVLAERTLAAPAPRHLVPVAAGPD